VRILILISVLLFFLSCKKNDTASLPNSFIWIYAGSNFTACADTVFTSTFSGEPVIIARRNADPAFPNEKFLISLTSLGEGTYTFGITAPFFSYIDDAGNTLYGSGSFTISSNKNNLLNGNFSTTLTNTKTITGQFTSMPIKP
jgi:hypothetical protein